MFEVQNFSMNSILCVIDLTGSAVNVLAVATEMARAINARLIILFPYRLIDKNYSGNMTELRKKLEQEAHTKFEALRNSVSGFDLLSHDFHPEIGFPVDRIKAYSTTIDLKMIAISYAQANSINETNSGSLQKLISHLRLPFLIIPEFSPKEEPWKIRE